MPGRIVLEIQSGAHAGRRWELRERDTFVFGRANDCHVIMPADDLEVSRHHFVLEATPPRAWLRDLGSLNGTFVNDQPHGGRAAGESPEAGAERRYRTVQLVDGDRVRVGRTTIALRIEKPIVCDRCVQELDNEEAEFASRLGSPLLCRRCRTQDVPETQPPATVRSQCQECGRDMADEIGTPLRDWICVECLTNLKSGSTRPLGRILQSAISANETPRIPGLEVGRILGRGGFGAVYEARQGSETYAVKVMLAEVAVAPHSRRSFLREIEIGAHLEHENLVPILDFGAEGALFYFVMPFGSGGSLQDKMNARDDVLPIEEAVPLMLPALSGMEFAHQRGFVHRDVKPSNVLLFGDRRKPVVRVTDFGLAKNFEQAGFTGPTMTPDDAFAGTFAYMPPEQITNYRYVQPVSDVYALGATLYYLLTKSYVRDFGNDDPISVVLDARRQVPIRERLPSLPDRLAAVVDRAVAHDVRDRFQTAGELHHAISEAT